MTLIRSIRQKTKLRQEAEDRGNQNPECLKADTRTRIVVTGTQCSPYSVRDRRSLVRRRRYRLWRRTRARCSCTSRRRARIRTWTRSRRRCLARVHAGISWRTTDGRCRASLTSRTYWRRASVTSRTRSNAHITCRTGDCCYRQRSRRRARRRT